MTPVILKHLFVFACVLSAVACTPPAELDGEELEPSLPWDELVQFNDEVFSPTPGYAIDDVQLTPERLGRLPWPLRQSPKLSWLALSRGVDQPISYQNGVFGLIGSAKFFATTTDKVRDYDHLYWVMVKVLSEKYGCFMTTKQNVGDEVNITCRDKRVIRFWRSQGTDWIQFYARQFDRQGYEIKVEKRRVVRISAEPVLYTSAAH
jgi:hypothetical protein